MISKCFMVPFSRTGWLPVERVFPCVKFPEDSGVVSQCEVRLLRMLLRLAVDFLRGLRRHVHLRSSVRQRSRRILLAAETAEELRLLQPVSVMAWILV